MNRPENYSAGRSMRIVPSGVRNVIAGLSSPVKLALSSRLGIRLMSTTAPILEERRRD
jgi:hypothetical protein